MNSFPATTPFLSFIAKLLWPSSVLTVSVSLPLTRPKRAFTLVKATPAFPQSKGQAHSSPDWPLRTAFTMRRGDASHHMTPPPPHTLLVHTVLHTACRPQPRRVLLVLSTCEGQGRLQTTQHPSSRHHVPPAHHTPIHGTCHGKGTTPLRPGTASAGQPHSLPYHRCSWDSNSPKCTSSPAPSPPSTPTDSHPSVSTACPV